MRKADSPFACNDVRTQVLYVFDHFHARREPGLELAPRGQISSLSLGFTGIELLA